MKSIKNIALFMLAATAFIFSACGNNNGNEPKDNPMYVKFEGKTITKDTSVVVSKVLEAFTEGAYEMKFDCIVVNNTKKENEYTIHEERNFDLTKYTTSGCVHTCVPGNGEKTQTWELGMLAPEEEQSFQGHFEISKDMAGIDGKFDEVFTISDGTNKIKINVTFDYKAQK